MPRQRHKSNASPSSHLGRECPVSVHGVEGGSYIAESLGNRWDVKVFDDQFPDCDVVVLINFKPDASGLRQLRHRTSIVYTRIVN